MQRIDNDPYDITEFLKARGVEHALEAGLLLEDKDLDVTYKWNEPLLLSSAMDVLRQLGHQDDYELLALHTPWEKLCAEALLEGDELALWVCLDYVSLPDPREDMDDGDPGELSR